MRAYKLPVSDVKNFMGRLLREEVFNLFTVRNIELTLATHITISGKLEKDDEEKKYINWGEIQTLVYDLIKKSAKPKLIKIIFSHTNPGEVHNNAAALFLNFSYENDNVTFTTATAQREFSLDKSLDNTWDEWVMNYFNKINVTMITPPRQSINATEAE